MAKSSAFLQRMEAKHQQNMRLQWLLIDNVKGGRLALPLERLRYQVLDVKEKEYDRLAWKAIQENFEF